MKTALVYDLLKNPNGNVRHKIIKSVATMHGDVGKSKTYERKNPIHEDAMLREIAIIKTLFILFEISNPFIAGIIKNDVISKFPAVRIPIEIAAPIVR